jgi:hypothetical protein
MYLCIKQQLKHLTKQQYLDLRELSHTAKNLYNVGVYNVSENTRDFSRGMNRHY